MSSGSPDGSTASRRPIDRLAKEPRQQVRRAFLALPVPGTQVVGQAFRVAIGRVARRNARSGWPSLASVIAVERPADQYDERQQSDHMSASWFWGTVPCRYLFGPIDPSSALSVRPFIAANRARACGSLARPAQFRLELANVDADGFCEWRSRPSGT